MTQPDAAPERGADLLYGVPAIAEFMSLSDRQIYYLIERGNLPSFKIGGRVCARRSTLATWLAEQEAAARGGQTNG
jgi:excisionase family DNA binding protein